MGILNRFFGSYAIDNTQGAGIKFGSTLVSPDYGYTDIIKFHYFPDTAGADAPTLTTFDATSGVRINLYAANDRADFTGHVMHDVVAGKDLWFHLHVAHNGTSASGNFVYTVGLTHVRGHRGGAVQSIAPKTVTINFSTLSQRYVDITDVLIGQNGGGAGLLNTATGSFEPDDHILASVIVTSIPTITGGDSGVFIIDADCHGQTTGINATKNKSPNFYT